MLSILYIIAIIIQLSSAQKAREQQVPEGGYFWQRTRYSNGAYYGWICPGGGRKVTAAMTKALVQGTANTEDNHVPFKCSKNPGQIIVWTCWIKTWNAVKKPLKSQCPDYDEGYAIVSGGNRPEITAATYTGENALGYWQAPGLNNNRQHYGHHYWGKCMYTKTCPARAPDGKTAEEVPHTVPHEPKRLGSVSLSGSESHHEGVGHAPQPIKRVVSTSQSATHST